MSDADSSELFDIPPELADLVDDYLERRRGDAEALRVAVGAGDFDEARRLGHNMKGSGAGYGFARISELGAAMQSAAEARDFAALERLAGELDEYTRKVRVALESL